MELLVGTIRNECAPKRAVIGILKYIVLVYNDMTKYAIFISLYLPLYIHWLLIICVTLYTHLTMAAELCGHT